MLMVQAVIGNVCMRLMMSKQHRFAMEFMLQDTADADNVGIRSLYVIRLADDPNPQRAYRGDGENTPGININKNA